VSDYDPRNILKQSPEALRDWVLTILAVLVVLDAVELSGEATAVIGLLVYKTLTLFYVQPAQKAKVQKDLTALSELSPDPKGGK
jgi:3-oxoacyl-[acyl-carrier-protein] synthase III